MATDFSPTDANHVVITDNNGNPIPQIFDPSANGGDGGWIALYGDDDNIQKVKQSEALPAGDNNIGNVDIITDDSDKNLLSINGTSQTGADWTTLFQHLNVDLGTLLQTADLTFNGTDLQISIATDELGLFKTSDFTETRQINGITTVGTEGNAWDSASTGVNGNSNAIDLQNVSKVDIFGNVSGATDITIYKSQDNTNFYNSGIVIEITSGEDFAVNNLPVGARYIRLQSSNDVTATATVTAKM